MSHAIATPRSNTAKPLLTFSGMVIVLFLLLLAIAFIVATIFSSPSSSKAIEAYLHDKYGSDIEFIPTNEGGGGGIDINSYYAFYTTPDLNDRKFDVSCSRKDGEIVVACDGYQQAKFADEVQNLFADIVSSLGYNEFRIGVAEPVASCDISEPTNDFYEYFRNPKASIFATIVIQNDPARTVDKTALADAFISRLNELNYPQKSDTISNTFARVEVLDDQCSYLEPLYECPQENILEEFWLTLAGYEDVPI